MWPHPATPQVIVTLEAGKSAPDSFPEEMEGAAEALLGEGRSYAPLLLAFRPGLPVFAKIRERLSCLNRSMGNPLRIDPCQPKSAMRCWLKDVALPAEM
jgi:hypothetical protein